MVATTHDDPLKEYDYDVDESTGELIPVSDSYGVDESANARLNEIAARLDEHITATLDSIMKVGQDLSEARVLVRHGLWGAWVQHNFTDKYGLSRSQADRWIDVYERFADSKERVEKLPISIIYQLASPSTPESAVQEILTLIEAGEAVNGKSANGIIDNHKQGISTLAAYIGAKAPDWLKGKVQNQDWGVRPAYDLLKAIEFSAESIREVALKHGVREIGVLTLLGKYLKNASEEFENIATSGLVSFEGEEYHDTMPIPLLEITSHEMQAAYSAYRKEQGIVDYTGNGPVIHMAKPCTIYSVETDSDGRHFATLLLDDDGAKSLSKFVGQRKHVTVKELRERD